MNHDIQAAWATSELAQRINTNTASVFSNVRAQNITAYASRESRVEWPIADGVISVDEGTNSFAVAVEFKRENEGLHGVLTALGQAHSYLRKGYAGAIIVIPNQYESHMSPGSYLTSVIEYTSPDLPIAVFTYSDPNPTLTSPFSERLNPLRLLNLENSPLGQRTPVPVVARAETQWAHLREGSSDADAFYKYLQIAKLHEAQNGQEYATIIPEEIRNAVERVSPGVDPFHYLSFCTGDSIQDQDWRYFWFTHILNQETMLPWTNEFGVYTPNNAATTIMLPEGRPKMFFAGRTDSIKNSLVSQLNERSIDELEALNLYVTNVHNRAHSYREDIDSGLEHLGLLENDGRPSNIGYRFIDTCERHGGANSGMPRALLGAILLKNGQLAAFLHYIYRLSEQAFSENSFKFTNHIDNRIVFQRDEYLSWIESQLANNLRVMRKVSVRGGRARRPFQAELALLRQYGFVGSFRLGVGLEINWPAIQESLELCV